jgi:glycosyltransferase involved in cell wall biosynthesis
MMRFYDFHNAQPMRANPELHHPSVLVSTPDLRPSLFSILQGLEETGLLARVATTVSLSPGQIEVASRIPLVGQHLALLLNRRKTPAFLAGKVDNIWVRELLRSASAKLASPLLTHRIWEWAETTFDRIVARRYAGRFDLIYGMEHSSASTFVAQKASGGRCVLRQVTAHARTINSVLIRESRRFCELVPAHHDFFMGHIEKGAQRKEVEYGLADLIVANSDYVRKTFIANGVPAAKVISIPTGCPRVDSVGGRSGRGSGPLRLLYAGTLSLRKGFPYLLEAWRIGKFGPRAELIIAGNAELDIVTGLQSEPNVRYLGMLSRDALSDLYRQSDIMVLPTLCEGRAHSVLEALSFGLPVITTDAAGVGDLVVEGENGFIIPESDAGALASAIERAIEQRADLATMGARSMERARSWTIAHSNREHLARLCDFLKLRD